MLARYSLPDRQLGSVTAARRGKKERTSRSGPPHRLPAAGAKCLVLLCTLYAFLSRFSVKLHYYYSIEHADAKVFW